MNKHKNKKHNKSRTKTTLNSRTRTRSKTKTKSNSKSKSKLKTKTKKKYLHYKASGSGSKSKTNSNSSSSSSSSSSMKNNRLSKVSSDVFTHNLMNFLNVKNVSHLSSVSKNMRKKSKNRMDVLKPKAELKNKLKSVLFLNDVHEFIQNLDKKRGIDSEYSYILTLLKEYNNTPEDRRGDILYTLSEYTGMLGMSNDYDDYDESELLRREERYLLKEFYTKMTYKEYAHVKFIVVTKDKSKEYLKQLNDEIESIDIYNNSLENIQQKYKAILKKIKDIMEDPVTNRSNSRVYEKEDGNKKGFIGVHPMKLYAHFDFF